MTSKKKSKLGSFTKDKIMPKKTSQAKASMLGVVKMFSLKGKKKTGLQTVHELPEDYITKLL